MSSKLKRKLVLDYIAYMIGWGLVVTQGVLTFFVENAWYIGILLLLVAIYYICHQTHYMIYILTKNYSIALAHCADKSITGGRYASYHIYPVSLNGIKHHHLRTLSDFGINVSYWTYRKIKKGDIFIVIATPNKVKCYLQKYMEDK